MHLVVFLICFFSVFYSIRANNLPFSFKELVALGGLGYFFIDSFSRKVKLKRKYLNIAGCLLCLALWNVFSCTMNGTSEYKYFRSMFSLMMNFGAVYFLVKISKRYIANIPDLCRYTIIICLMQCAITLLLFLRPSLFNTLSIFISSEGFESFLGDYQVRLMGIGNFIFFGVLTTSNIGILMCVYMFYISRRFRQKLFYLAAFYIIALVTFLNARTFVFSIAVAIALYVYLNFRRKDSGCLLFFATSLVICAAPLFLHSYINEDMYRWAFESLLNDESKDNTKNEVIDWITNTHFELKTLMLGDGRFSNKDGSYYMHLDIGVYRAIFFVGIPGLLLELLYQFKILNEALKFLTKDNLFRYVLLSYGLLYIVMLFKGYNNVVFELMLILVMFDYGRIFSDNDNYSVKSKSTVSFGQTVNL